MIARLWTGTARTTAAGNDYEAHLTTHVLPVLHRITGFCGIQVLRRATRAGVVFQVTTFWESLDHIRAFAGDDVEAAVVADEAKALLVVYDTRALHFDVARTVGVLIGDQPL